jgi:hypothetical protein
MRNENTSTFFGVVDPNMLIIREEKKARFRRVMNFLGFVPHLSPEQIVSVEAQKPVGLFSELEKNTAPSDHITRKAVQAKLKNCVQGEMIVSFRGPPQQLKRIIAAEQREWSKPMNIVATKTDLAIL